eukprot:Em0001g2325a
MIDRHISVPGRFTGGDFSEWIQRFEICSMANEWDEDAMARKLPTLLEKEALVCCLDIPAETKMIFKDVKRLLIDKLRPSGFVTLAEFQARKLSRGETALLYVHELKRLLEDAMPNLDANSQDRILLIPAAISWTPRSRALRAIPEKKTTADAVSRARLLMTVSHQASVPTVASVNAGGKDSQTAAIDTLQGHALPGSTTVAHHTIPTADHPPVRVPPRRVPAHYNVPKKSGEIRICIDYRELNKQTVNLPTAAARRSSRPTLRILSVLKARPTFWMLAIAVKEEDCMKTAFCTGPGMGLYEFCRMPFWVAGGPSSFQRLMDKQVFERLANAGLTLRGSKCQLGLDKVHYLGHVQPIIASYAFHNPSYQFQASKMTNTCAGTVTVTLEDVVQEQGKDEVLNEPTALKANHDIISSGHQGVEKTLQRLKRTAYWIGMANDTELYCRSCIVCQRSKLPMPTPVPMTNIPIGHPWQMLAVDVLQVPWAEGIPMPNQTAEYIAGILIDLFSRFGIPGILHSDQGANFESTMIRRCQQIPLHNQKLFWRFPQQSCPQKDKRSHQRCTKDRGAILNVTDDLLIFTKSNFKLEDKLKVQWDECNVIDSKA